MKKLEIAITGGGGFLGRHLVTALEKDNFSIRIFNRVRESLFKPETLANFLKGKDIVIHLAAANRADNLKLLRVNTLGTLGLLEAISQYAPEAKLIFSSSFQVYFQEKNVYALSKKFAEELIEEYVKKNLLREAIILRIANIYGPGCRPFYNSVIATFVHQIKNNQPLTINGDGRQRRDYIYVEDVVSAIVKSLSYQPRRRVEFFNICSGKLTSLNEIVKILKKVSLQEVKVEYNRDMEIKEEEIRKNYQKAKKCLNWQPKTGLLKGLKLTFKGGYET